MPATPPPWALAFLREARVGRLATVDAGGRPLVLPVCFAFEDDAIYSAVDDKPKRTRELRRLRNVAQNPHVSLVVDEWSEDWARLRWVIVEGEADVLRDGAEVGRAVDLLVAKYPQYRTMDLRTQAAVLRVRVGRLLAWRASES